MAWNWFPIFTVELKNELEMFVQIYVQINDQISF